MAGSERIHRLMSGNKRRVFWICGLFLISAAVAISIYKGPSFLHMDTRISLMKIAPNLFRTENNVSQESSSTENSGQYYKYKVICMILTTASNWETKGKAVRNTWAKRCHKAIFFYTRIENCFSQPICNESSAVGLNVPDGRDHLTAKTLGALNYSYAKYGAEADYFLKADDDTYVIAENLQKMLSRFRSIPLLYLGRKSENILPKGYNSGGAGYIISNEAVRLLIENRTMYPSECRPDGGFEDVEIGRCLAKFKIYPQDDLDSTGRLTFHSDSPLRVLLGEAVANAYYVNFSGAEFGNKKTLTQRGFMMSQWTATMHYVRPAEIYMFDFLLYHLRKRNDIGNSLATDD